LRTTALADLKGGEGRTRVRERGNGGERGEWERERKRWKLGIAPWLLWG